MTIVNNTLDAVYEKRKENQGKVSPLRDPDGTLLTSDLMPKFSYVFGAIC